MPRVILRSALAVALCALLAPFAAAQANWGEVEGRITELATGGPIPGATVLVEGTNYGTAAGTDGRFALRLPDGRYALIVRAVGYEGQRDSVTVRRRQVAIFNVVLAESTVEMEGATVEATGVQQEAGVTVLNPEDVEAMPDPLNDALGAVKTVLGVTSNNASSNAYSVRGGGYNENQFFINGFEVYRPIRTRQGEQEGLSLANGDLMDRMTLYAGGFPTRYGGKLSSVLDVSYARPIGPLSGSLYGSTLDAGASIGGGLMNNRVGVALAARNSRPRQFFASQELEGVYDPNYFDGQAVLTADLAEGHSLRGVGIVARNRFRLEPAQRETTFGIFPNQLRTVAFQFDGLEEDGYDIRFGGLTLSDRFGNLVMEHSASYYETEEFETFDVSGDVTLFRLERDPNRPPNDPFNQIATGQAQQRDVADNNVRVGTLTGGGRYRLGIGRHLGESGWQLRRITFDDRLFELSQLAGRDSLGNDVLVTVDSLSDAVELNTWQAAAWAETTVDLLPTPGRLVATLGARADYFEFNDEWTIGPRLNVRYRVDANTTVSGATGLYYQAPTYLELRGELDSGDSTILGALNSDLQSQRALLFVGGAEHFFTGTRFSVRGEAWYKQLDNLISYEIENTRVTYSGENDSEGYAYGIDLQVRGELVPGLESWLNYGYLKSEEQFFDEFIVMNPRTGLATNDGMRARPTDRRHNVSLFVQDYIPGDDSWSLHMRTLFGTGLPYTPPALNERIDGADIFVPGQRTDGRYPEYFRFDMGATKEVRIGRVPSGAPLMLKLTAEVLNVFDMKNTITFSWIDAGNNTFEGVPTRLTPRTVNVRARIDF